MAAAVAAVSMVSCDNDDSKPTIEFSKTLYTVYQKGDVDVDVVVSGPAETDLTVPLTFIGNAEKGVDYTASAESVVIKAGESSGSVTITNVSLSEEKQVSLGFTVPEGYSMGTKIVAVIAPSSQEALVYSFSMTKFDALEGCLATVNVVGTLTGKDFKADEDIYVPLAVSGEGASKLSFTVEGTTPTTSTSAKPGVFALIHAGESSGVAKFKVEDGFSGDLKAEISVNEEADSRFIAGDNSKMEVAVKGLQTPDKLVGTWKFSKVFSKDEMDMWFMEYEDDPEALPTHNEGFTLTFAKESDGTVSLTPGGKGDFLNFFRKATVTLGEPKTWLPKAWYWARTAHRKDRCSSRRTRQTVVHISPTHTTSFRLQTVHSARQKRHLEKLPWCSDCLPTASHWSSAIMTSQLSEKCGLTNGRNSTLTCSVSHHSS